MSNGDTKDKKRVTRIKRIFQNDDIESDNWVDVERIEEVWVETGGKGADWQERHYTFDWELFDSTSNPRKRISNPADVETFIAVPIRDKTTVATKGAARYQKYIHSFLNDETNRSRRTYSRKIYHYDIDARGISPDGQPPSDPQEYLRFRQDKPDKATYVEVEILVDYWASGRINRDIHGRDVHGSPAAHGKPDFPTHGHWQQRVWRFSDKSLLLDDDPAALTGIKNPEAGPQVDPPWRLDPLQNIINVNWGGLAVIFGPGAEDAPKPSSALK